MEVEGFSLVLDTSYIWRDVNETTAEWGKYYRMLIVYVP